MNRMPFYIALLLLAGTAAAHQCPMPADPVHDPAKQSGTAGCPHPETGDKALDYPYRWFIVRTPLQQDIPGSGVQRLKPIHF